VRRRNTIRQVSNPAKFEKKREMKSFFTTILDKDERRHQAILEASSRETDIISTEESEEDLETKARRINEVAGYEKVKINDSGELVDERQLLAPGLNAAPKKKTSDKTTSDKSLHRYRNYSRPTRKPDFRSRTRETELVVQQLMAQEWRKRQQEEDSRALVMQQLKSRKTDDAITSARERYLARKRQS
jgi:coiled-coil domain-containing protein 55